MLNIVGGVYRRILWQKNVHAGSLRNTLIVTGLIRMKNKLIAILLILGMILLTLVTFRSISDNVDRNEFQSTEINSKVIIVDK
jgi:type II secretory pathway component PulL